MKLSNIHDLGRYKNRKTGKEVNLKQGGNSQRGTDIIFYLYRGKKQIVPDAEFYSSGDWIDITIEHMKSTRVYKSMKKYMILEILKDQPRLGLKKGHWYNGEPYWLYPSEKFTLLNRVSKSGRNFKKDPHCNQYRSDVKIIKYGKPLIK
jgi:hypothetical protein